MADGTGYRATAVLWFRAETDEVSGFCPDTDALRRICERIYKDGPLEMRMSLDKPAPHGTAGWHGTVSSTGWPAGTFEVDLYRGSAIADWGDEEPGAFYLRFRSPGVLPGGEEVGWLKIEPMGRAPVSLDELAERGTFDRPPAMPPAPPSGAQGLAGDACAAVGAFWYYMAEAKPYIWIDRVPTKDNIADGLSRGERARPEWVDVSKAISCAPLQLTQPGLPGRPAGRI